MPEPAPGREAWARGLPRDYPDIARVIRFEAGDPASHHVALATGDGEQVPWSAEFLHCWGVPAGIGGGASA